MKEARLNALREEAKARGHVDGAGGAVTGSPFPKTSGGYYGQPVVKAPVWTWEIPAYFFVGGVAGMAAVIGAVAELSGADLALARDARWIAAAGAVISPALLISDLGRPSRFMNMLRVFKPQSPMSVGAWTLVAFSGAIAAAVPLHFLDLSGVALIARSAIDVVAALLGLVLATYTGVLLGVSAVPLWAAHAARLPLLFAASSLGAAVSVVELSGHMTRATNAIGIAAAAADLLAGAWMASARLGAVTAPQRTGRSGALIRLADLLGGLAPLVLRLVWSGSSLARTTAAICAIGGSLLLRYGWMAAGRVSTADPSVVLDRRG